MAYAKTDENNRVLMWSYEKLDGFDKEFSNGDYIDEKCTDGLNDFIIENGKAVFSPLPEKEIERLKKKLSDTDYISAKIMDSLVGCSNITDFFSLMTSFHSEYGGKIADRKKWRERINELEEGGDRT